MRTRGWCQANANRSPNWRLPPALCRELTPLGQRGGAVLFEDGAAVEMAVEIEVVGKRSSVPLVFLSELNVGQDLRIVRRGLHGKRRQNGRPFGRLERWVCGPTGCEIGEPIGG